MLETHIKILATIYTAVFMALISYVLIYGGINLQTPSIKGKVIQATMVDISQLKSRPKSKKEPKKPIKKTEPKKTEPKKKEPIKKVEKKKAEPIKKKDPPIIPKKTEPKVDTKAQEIERKKRQERQKKLKEIQKKRKTIEQRRKQEEQNLKELAEKIKQETRTPVKTENIGTTKGTSQASERQKLMLQYQLTVISSVERQWNKPVSANEHLLCHVKVRQIPGGGVMDATISSPCNANTIVKKSILAAIKKADPLPYKGFESVFSRTATFIFQPSEN